MGQGELKKKAYDPTGTWEYVVETPDGANGGTLVIAGNPGAYTAVLNTDQFGELEISDVDVVDTNMTGSIEVMGNVAELECSFDGDEMSLFPVKGKLSRDECECFEWKLPD